VRFLFLALLGAGPAHGYDLKRAYDARFGAIWGPLNIGQVYTTMARLERDGLVTHETVAQGDRPDKKVYAITPAGRAALASWLDEAEDVPAVKSDVVLKLVAARLTGADPMPILAQQRQRYLQSLRDLDALLALTGNGDAGNGGNGSGNGDGANADDDDDVRSLLVEGAVLHVDAELRWLDFCEQRLRDDSPTARRAKADKGESL
jgi:DNA-binding PadR family transcriptional regulator